MDWWWTTSSSTTIKRRRWTRWSRSWDGNFTSKLVDRHDAFEYLEKELICPVQFF